MNEKKKANKRCVDKIGVYTLEISSLIMRHFVPMYAGTCTLMLGRHLGFLKPNSSNSLCVKLANELRIYFMALRDSSYGLPFWKLLTTPMYKQFVESEDAIYK